MANKKWSSLEDALAETQHLLSNNPDLSEDSPELPHYQYVAMEKLSQLEKYFKEDKFCLMDAMAICARHGLSMPEWVSQAYLDGFYKITTAKENSLDVVFGRPYPKGAHINKIRKKRNLRFRVYNEINRVLKNHPSLPKDDYLFEEVGKKYNLGKTLTSEFYYEVNRMIKLQSTGEC